MWRGRILVFLGAGLLLLGGALMAAPLRSSARQPATPANDAMLRPAVDLVEAQEIALREFPGFTVWSIELDRENRGLVYEVSLGSGEVDLDAMTGDVLRTEWDD